MTSIQKTLFGARMALSVAVALAGFGSSMALADGHCGCDKACTEKCEKGDNKDCSCKSCGHGQEGHKCEGKCDHDHDKAANAKSKKKTK